MNVDVAFENILRGYKSGRFAHAYVLVGGARTVGIPLATRMLQMLVCEGPDSPCGTCRLCGQVAGRTYPDVQWVEPQKKSRRISIQQVRALQHVVLQTSFAGSWKGCVLVGADRLGMEAANALLKTLEEPPAETVFLLLTDSPQVMLPTIVSRCQYVGLSGGECVEEAWAAELMSILDGRQRGAGGRALPGPTVVYAMTDRICGLLKGLRAAAQEEELALAREGVVEEAAETLEARAGARYREVRTALMRTLSDWYRDLLICVCEADTSALHFPGRVEQLVSRARGVSYRQARRNIEIVESMNRQLENNMPEALVFSSGFSSLTG